MKIKVNAVLRSPDLVADPGDIIPVDDKTGNLLIGAGAAELVEEVAETFVIIEPAEVVTHENIVAMKAALEEASEPLKPVEETEEPKPIKKGALKK
jgi:hypothetical protein